MDTNLKTSGETYWMEARDITESMDPDAARVRAQAAGIRFLSTPQGLIFRTDFLVSNSDLAESDRQAAVIDQVVLGTRAAIPVPEVLRSLKLVRPESVKRELSSPQGTAARTVEASYMLAAGDAHAAEQALVLLYLQGLAEVQEDDSLVADAAEGTLEFLVTHWDAGDLGCAHRYRQRREATHFEIDDWVAMARDL